MPPSHSNDNGHKAYPIWKALFLSFYSPEIYKDVAKNWRGFALSYILLLSAIVCAIMMLGWLNTIYKIDIKTYAAAATKQLFEDPDFTFEENLNRVLNIAAQIPKVTISDGEASITESSPYLITDPLTKKTLAIINIDGKSDPIEKTDASVLLSKTKVTVKNNNGDQEVIFFKNLKQQFDIDEQDINKFINMIAQIPLITIKQGEASISETSPYVIKNDDKAVTIIDTEGTTKSFDDNESHILLTKDKLFIKNPFEKNVTEVALSAIDADMINNAIVYTLKQLRHLLTIVPLLITPIFIIASFTFAVFIVFVYAIIALMISRLFKLGTPEFSQAFRLSAVAITPIIALNLVIPQVFANQGLIYFLIALGYIYFALNSNRTITI
jgi:hypothetical protein